MMIASVIELKEKGNDAFRVKEYEKATALFSEAINLLNDKLKCDGPIEVSAEDSSLLSVCLLNRSISCAGQHQWLASFRDAKQAMGLAVTATKHYYKCYFRLVKSLIELRKFKIARLYLSNALKNLKADEHAKKLLESLEMDLFLNSGVALRPSPKDFEIIEELGDGNFSKVMKAKYKKTGAIYAVKTIDRMTVDRMKRRHPNINNEILMEKRALNKLDHPNVVELYCTFQDFGTLYYQMEFIGGCDLWTMLQERQEDEEAAKTDYPLDDDDEEENILGDDSLLAPSKARRRFSQVGCHWSLAIFYFAEAVEAIEHMHRRGIVHRDIKPENMIIAADGHLKIIDFGTAKDLVEVDLNGPEFVGTPEYMSPSTVRSKPKELQTGPAVDLWALGTVLYQMIMGFTPFNAASPYLTFLRIKRGRYMLPSYIPERIASMIRLLLEKDDEIRFASATGDAALATAVFSYLVPSRSGQQEPLQVLLSRISYDTLRVHDIFKGQPDLHSIYRQPNLSNKGFCQPDLVSSTSGTSSAAVVVDLLSYDSTGEPDYAYSIAIRIPTLHELCLRAVGKACLEAARIICEHGGAIPPEHPWIQRFQLEGRVRPPDRFRIAHYLRNRGKLHLAGVYRLFCAPGATGVVQSRSTRCDAITREYIGLTRPLQGHFHSNFNFVHISDPSFGRQIADDPNCEAEKKLLSLAISNINKLRPKFVVISGNFTASSPDNPAHGQQVDTFRRTMARLSDSISAVYVPGARDVGIRPTSTSLASYRDKFGADYFGFWFSGLRGIVLNSPLMIHPEGCVSAAADQDEWLVEEIEQSKLCGCHIVIFSYHRWFNVHMDEDDDTATAPESDDVEVFPRFLREKWLPLLRHHKARVTISSCSNSSSSANNNNNNSNKNLKPFPKKRSSSKKDNNITHTPVANEGGNEEEAKKPSEIIAEAEAAAGQGGADDDENEDNDDDDDDDNKEDEEFLNIEEDCEGPDLLHSDSITITSPDDHQDESSTTGSNSNNSSTGRGRKQVFVAYVEENDFFYRVFSQSSLPKSVAELTTSFQSST